MPKSAPKPAVPGLGDLPKIDELLKLAERDPELVKMPRLVVRTAARRVVDEMRARILTGGRVDGEPLTELLRGAIDKSREHSLAPVVNATGVVLHTGLGRAPLAAKAVRAAVEASQSCALEIERESGERGQRDSAVRELICHLTGAEDATAVNNNAAATLLAVNTFALGLDVIVSRGELVEIGGSYRMPAVVERGGAKLVEVGTTNRTRIADYRAALTKQTGLLMKVHTSNYRVKGFTEEATLAELAALGREENVTVVHDLGSGLLTRNLTPALRDEPTVAESMEAKPDLCLFSGDKLLGGPQAGIVAGRAEAVAAIRKNPMFRAMRLDKMILAALEATLRLHAEGSAASEIPALERLNLTVAEIQARAQALRAKLAGCGVKLDVDVAASTSEAGSGSAPTIPLETFCVVLTRPGEAAAETARQMRLSTPSVFTRIRDGRVWLDPRTLGAGDDDRIVDSLLHAFPS